MRPVSTDPQATLADAASGTALHERPTWPSVREAVAPATCELAAIPRPATANGQSEPGIEWMHVNIYRVVRYLAVPNFALTDHIHIGQEGYEAAFGVFHRKLSGRELERELGDYRPACRVSRRDPHQDNVIPPHAPGAHIGQTPSGCV